MDSEAEKKQDGEGEKEVKTSSEPRDSENKTDTEYRR